MKNEKNNCGRYSNESDDNSRLFRKDDDLKREIRTHLQSITEQIGDFLTPHELKILLQVEDFESIKAIRDRLHGPILASLQNELKSIKKKYKKYHAISNELLIETLEHSGDGEVCIDILLTAISGNIYLKGSAFFKLQDRSEESTNFITNVNLLISLVEMIKLDIIEFSKSFDSQNFRRLEASYSAFYGNLSIFEDLYESIK